MSLTNDRIEIRRIESKLENANDNSILFDSETITKLRNFVFQVHSEYEYIVRILIVKHFLNSDLRLEGKEAILDKIYYFDKVNLAVCVNENFPSNAAKSMNYLRNKFAHKDGMQLRYEYNTGAKYLKTLKSLEKYHDKLKTFEEALTQS